MPLSIHASCWPDRRRPSIGAACAGLHEHTFSGQYPQRESPDDRDQPVRTRKAPTFEVRLPRSARPGATIMAIAPNGKEVSAVVPLGSGPGSTITVRY